MGEEEDKAAAAAKTQQDIDEANKGNKLQIPGLPEDFYSLPKGEQTKLLGELAAKAKSAEDKESMIQKQGNELGELRKLKADVEPILQQLSGNGNTSQKSELDMLLESAKEKGYRPDDVEFFQKLMSFHSNESNKATKKVLGEVLTVNLNDAMGRDPDIDQDLYKKHEKEINEEYHMYKDPKTFGDAIKLLKRSAMEVQRREVEKLKGKEKEKYEADRDRRLAGIGEYGPKNPKGSRNTSDDNIGDDIVNAGKSNKDGGVFG